MDREEKAAASEARLTRRVRGQGPEEGAAKGEERVSDYGAGAATNVRTDFMHLPGREFDFRSLCSEERAWRMTNSRKYGRRGRRSGLLMLVGALKVTTVTGR